MLTSEHTMASISFRLLKLSADLADLGNRLQAKCPPRRAALYFRALQLMLNCAVQCHRARLSSQAHRATLTQNGHEWWLVYPVTALTVVDRDQESIDVRIPIAAGSYEDALEIVRLVLRTHKPPDVASHPAEYVTPVRNSAYHVLGWGALLPSSVITMFSLHKLFTRFYGVGGKKGLLFLETPRGGGPGLPGGPAHSL
jgi:hypothetical protein